MYEGAEYLIARPDDTQRLYRVAAGGVTDWQLAGIDVTAKSFAFVTAWGRLQIITKDAIGSCDLEKLGEPGSVVTCMVNEGPNSISIEPGERPAMGPDGSVYFRNVQTSGKIVAYNPSLQEIWRTDLIFTAISPVSLSEKGHFAYALAKFLDDQSRIALVRIDTATGETVASDIKYTDAEGDVYLPLIELLQPAAKSSVDSDYVFVAGNTYDTGIFQ